MMHRNLDRRVEVLVRVADPKLAVQLDATFASALDPATRCWVLHSDGQWLPSPVDGGSQVRDHQTELMLQHASREYKE
jgi:polyphosphate kinase